jgi:hypothetical protein
MVKVIASRASLLAPGSRPTLFDGKVRLLPFQTNTPPVGYLHQQHQCKTVAINL